MVMKHLSIHLLLLACLSAPATAAVRFRFEGNDGFGLRPGNEVGSNVATATTSTAIGGETQPILFDEMTNELTFGFSFEGLTGGLFDAASGIHLHQATPGTDPLNETGGIVFNLNSGTDANVSLTTPLLVPGPGTTSGTVAGTIQLSSAQAADLMNGLYYLNIHSEEFRGGELRANVTAIPEPSTSAILCLLSVSMLSRRRRQA